MPNKISKIISQNTKQTAKIAKDFICELLLKSPPSLKLRRGEGATVVCLSGELGAGKTSFTGAVAKYLGVKRKVNSPTFVIMKRYSLPLPRGSTQRARVSIFKNLFHLDAYRLKNAKELLHLGWEEIIKNPEHLVFVEWPENVAGAIPKKHHKINIAHTREGHRSFKIKSA